ncbi:hypothetical protein J7T55_005786 [Diaporthe amygdali]|uniref:uncharacterized protein n=1 Tax=Phomopsis amygdali TaxID=1214568 RepID=UPI0022FEBF0E|nr:uncharacterized protein J7T55_005786 [Diaporthe amygdali]KAJ0124448.1 hypothetical protein J7T55_005786 [Diaporthe amygdali]
MSSSSKLDSKDAQSESSSIVYGHESFAHFQPKVLALARSTIWPHSQPNDEIIVERLRGGGFNRILGLTLTHSQSKGQYPTDIQPIETRASRTPVEYILRILRFDASQVDADVAALLFVQRFLNAEQQNRRPEIPAPRVILFDETEDNCLESSFMVQNRLPGQPLIDAYPQLGHKQQLRVAQDLDQAYRRMLAKSSAQAGNQFCTMVSEMNAHGYFKNFNGHFALSHLDLEPRNILVDPGTSSDSPIISGILDWDSAVLAPAFMSCAPPMWIWNWQEDEDEDERLANEEPATIEQKELKTVFEAAAGARYVHSAYHPAYRLARRLAPDPKLELGDREDNKVAPEFKPGNNTLEYRPIH